MKLCLFSVDETGTVFGVDASRVVEFLRDLPLTNVPLVSPKLLGLLNIRGEVVPVFVPPSLEASGVEALRHHRRQGSYLVLEGGEDAGRFALPANSVDLADGERPADAAADAWLLPAETQQGRGYRLIDVEALIRLLRNLISESMPHASVASAG
jgi:chemotaxis signal transduction protein